MIDKYPAACPRHITPVIRGFALEIADCSDLCYVPIRAMAFCVPRMCYLNVFQSKDIVGGEPVLGFTIWATRDLFLTCEHHCVLRLPNGDLVDPTPEITGESRILFVPTGQAAVPDNIREIVMNGVSGHYRVLVDDPLIHRAVAVLIEGATRLHRENNLAVAEGRPLPAAEYRQWNDSATQMEWLMDQHYRRQRQRNEEREQRRKNKLQRKARKKTRTRK
jgi:hypothetical protein